MPTVWDAIYATASTSRGSGELRAAPGQARRRRSPRDRRSHHRGAGRSPMLHRRRASRCASRVTEGTIDPHAAADAILNDLEIDHGLSSSTSTRRRRCGRRAPRPPEDERVVVRAARRTGAAAADLTANPPGAVVVWGGERIFAAGAEISEFGGPDEASAIGGHVPRRARRGRGDSAGHDRRRQRLRARRRVRAGAWRATSASRRTTPSSVSPRSCSASSPAVAARNASLGSVGPRGPRT